MLRRHGTVAAYITPEGATVGGGHGYIAAASVSPSQKHHPTYKIYTQKKHYLTMVIPRHVRPIVEEQTDGAGGWALEPLDGEGGWAMGPVDGAGGWATGPADGGGGWAWKGDEAGEDAEDGAGGWSL